MLSVVLVLFVTLGTGPLDLVLVFEDRLPRVWFRLLLGTSVLRYPLVILITKHGGSLSKPFHILRASRDRS